MRILRIRPRRRKGNPIQRPPDLVLLPTRVQDKHGKTIYGLKAEQFMVDDNGERQKVEVDEQPDPFGLSLVVVVQCSRSAPGALYKIRGLGAMIDAVVGAASHEVAVLAYGDGPHLLGDFASSPNAERLALAKLKPCGLYRASTIDAVYYAFNMLRRRSTHYRQRDSAHQRNPRSRQQVEA